MSITSLRIAVVCDLKYATWKLYEWSVACACVLAETVLAIYESSKNLLFQEEFMPSLNSVNDNIIADS